MSQNNHKVVRDDFPHTIAILEIEHTRAAYDLIKWCIDNTEHSWHKHTVQGILYIQFQDTDDFAMFLLVWGTDPRIEYSVIDIAQQLGL